jgi:hypothetical protein
MSEFVGGKHGLCYGCIPDKVTAQKIELLLEQIEAMKCCGNCKSFEQIKSYCIKGQAEDHVEKTGMCCGWEMRK